MTWATDRDDRTLCDEALARIAQSEPHTQRGRRAASELLGRHRARVYGWCRRQVRDHERALDLAQEVLLTAHRALGGYEGRAPFTAWLFVIARRRCIRAMRPRRLVWDQDAAIDQLIDPGADPERGLEERQDRERLLGLMRDVLDPREQEALWLRYVENAPVDDITRVLGLTTVSGARGLLQTARRKLRAAAARGARTEAR